MNERRVKRHNGIFWILNRGWSSMWKARSPVERTKKKRGKKKKEDFFLYHTTCCYLITDFQSRFLSRPLFTRNLKDNLGDTQRLSCDVVVAMCTVAGAEKAKGEHGALYRCIQIVLSCRVTGSGQYNLTDRFREKERWNILPFGKVTFMAHREFISVVSSYKCRAEGNKYTLGLEILHIRR